MKRMIAAALTALSLVAGAQASEAKWTETDVTIGEGDGALHGTWLAPAASEGGMDAVLFISGSGPTDRDGNQTSMKNDSLKMLAHALGEAGIASLRVDKRGVAASMKAGPKEEDLRFDTYIDDARSWIDLIKTMPDVKRLFIIGHSEGALIGAVVAGDDEIAGYVSLAGAGLPAADVLRRQIKASPSGEQVLALAEPTLQKLEKGELDPAPSPLLMSLFRPSVQPYLISWFKVDPRVEIAKAKGRVQIVQGTTDFQVLVEDAESLKAARPDADYVLIEGMNHVLKVAPAERGPNAATYTDPALPLAPGVAEAIIGFIQQP
ncbi:MAG: alpha/beta hydrolase [Micropepsaceae bacterium]